jgi:ribosomal protein L11
MSETNTWKKKLQDKGINTDDFIDSALSGGKLAQQPEPVALTIVETAVVPEAEIDVKHETGSLEALLKELKDIESGKKKAGKHKKVSISIDAVTYLKIEIMKKKFEEGFFMEVPFSKVIGSAIDEHYDTKYRKNKKPKAP